jgi:glycosyltransferase involved in cell wall biosynthesis
MPDLQNRPWTATLAGNGPVPKYRAEAASMGLADRVFLPGWQSADQVKALLAEADIFVLPSQHEGLPMAILEAMAGGVPVIATPVGAIGDAIRDGQTGLLVPPGDVGALAAALARLLDNAGLRHTLATNARARFEAMFTIERTADSTTAMYRDIELASDPAREFDCERAKQWSGHRKRRPTASLASAPEYTGRTPRSAQKDGWTN